MGRSARRAAPTRSAADMATSRDTGTVRDMQFHHFSKMVNQVPGPGEGMKQDISRVNLDLSHNRLLIEWGSIFVSVLYIDLLFPSYTTPYRLKELAALTSEIAAGCVDESKKTFRGLATRLRKAAKTAEDQIYFENSMKERKVKLYDLVLNITTEYGLNLSGLLPTM